MDINTYLIILYLNNIYDTWENKTILPLAFQQLKTEYAGYLYPIKLFCYDWQDFVIISFCLQMLEAK